MVIPDFKLERFFSCHEFTAPWLLCSSDCESMSVGELLALDAGAGEKFKSLSLGYTETQGHPELRARVADLYETMSPEDIIIFSGAEEAIFIFMNVLLEREAHAVVLFGWIEPKAGPIAFPRLLTGRNIEEFCRDLVEKKGVLLLPGTMYGFDDRHFRVGYGRENMPSALARLEEFMQSEEATIR